MSDVVGGPAPGLAVTIEHVVAPEDTAIAVGSGDVPVLGTPRLIALAEAATVAAVAGALPDDATSVGTRVLLEHRRATAVGAAVTIEARLVAVDGPRLSFEVRAEQVESGVARLVATGEIDRVVVARDGFLARVPRP